MYARELDDRKLERAVAMERMSGRRCAKVRLQTGPRGRTGLSLTSSSPVVFQDGSLPKIAPHGHARDNLQEVDSDQESARNTSSDNRQPQTKGRRHTLPPIFPEAEL